MTDFTFDLYDDLDVVMDGRIEITDVDPGYPAPDCNDRSSPKFSDPGAPGLTYGIKKIILTINSTEIEIEGEAAEKIRQALDVRIVNKIKSKIEEMEEDACEYKVLYRRLA